MPVDTRDKRASAIGVAQYYLVQGPLPDGTLNAGDRQHVAMSYRGIAADAPPALGPHMDANWGSWRRSALTL